MGWWLIVAAVLYGLAVTIGASMLLSAIFGSDGRFGARNDAEESVKGYKMIGRGTFECATGALLNGRAWHVHFEEGGFCTVRGVSEVRFERGTVIRVYKHKHTNKHKIVADIKFPDVA